MQERAMYGQDNFVESQERFMERMEFRDKNARIIASIDDALLEEVPFFDSEQEFDSEVNKRREKIYQLLEPMTDSLLKKKLISKMMEVFGFVERYFTEVVKSQKFELAVKERLRIKNEKDGVVYMGAEIFRQKTNHGPVGEVSAQRQGGYFLVTCLKDKDYFDFIGPDYTKNSRGTFHRAVRFSNMVVDVVLIKGNPSAFIISHERQHFINNSVFNGFVGIENYNSAQPSDFPVLVRDVNIDSDETRSALRGVKDELLARIRDLSDAMKSTNFLEKNLYGDLRSKFTEPEQAELKALLVLIEKELKEAFNLFDSSFPQINRSVIVYHLVDVPLLDFPQRIKDLVKFYRQKLSLPQMSA